MRGGGRPAGLATRRPLPARLDGPPAANVRRRNRLARQEIVPVRLLAVYAAAARNVNFSRRVGTAHQIAAPDRRWAAPTLHLGGRLALPPDSSTESRQTARSIHPRREAAAARAAGAGRQISLAARQRIAGWRRHARQQLGQFRAVTLRAPGLLTRVDQQFGLPAATLTDVFVQTNGVGSRNVREELATNCRFESPSYFLCEP